MPKRVIASGVLGVAVLSGAGMAALLTGGSTLPVMEIRNAAATDATTSTTVAGANTAKPARAERTPLDEATEAKVKAAALEAVPGATFNHAHKMKDGTGYKALLTKADGTTKVLVTEDANFKVTNVQDPAPARPGGRRHDKSSLDAATVAKAKAAALEAVPGATFNHVHQMPDNAGYKVLLTKADGTKVLVTEDAAFKVTKVEDPAPARKGPGDRTPLDEATTAKVKAAALEAVPGATFNKAGHDRADGYVALLTKADGTTRVAVHLDKDFKVTEVKDPAPARGPGGHGPGHGPRGDKPADAPAGEGTNA